MQLRVIASPADKGSCMLWAENTSTKLTARGIDHKVIEGWVRFKGLRDFDFQHTWIEFEDGRILDETLSQFQGWDLNTVEYKKRKSYTPEQKFPVRG